MIVPLILIPLSMCPTLVDSGPTHKCKFPGDCLAHDTSRTDLSCEKKSDRWQQYQNVTLTEREKMRTRWREPMRDRIMRIYEVDASQEQMIRNEVDAIYADQRARMDTVFEAAKRLDEAIRDYTATFAKRLRETEQNDSLETEEAVLRRLQDDAGYQDLLDRRRGIEGWSQIDWNNALKRIERRLPEVQVVHGRARLAVELPHRCCIPWIEDAPINAPRELNSLETIHPWEAYTQRFIDRYRLNAGQIGAAKSILREVRQRAAQLDRRRFEELAAAHNYGNSKAIQARIEEFELRIDDLFDELNMRLDALPTTSQRQVLAPEQPESTTPAEIP